MKDSHVLVGFLTCLGVASCSGDIVGSDGSTGGTAPGSGGGPAAQGRGGTSPSGGQRVVPASGGQAVVPASGGQAAVPASGGASSGGNSGTGGAATALAAACNAACATQANLGCAGFDASTCSSGCQTTTLLAPDCVPEYGAFVQCAAARPASDWQCDTDGPTLRSGVCSTESLAFTACYLGGDVTATPSAACMAYCTKLASIVCTNPQDSSICSQQCGLIASAFVTCATQADTFFSCAATRPTSDYQCDADGNPTLSNAVCVAELGAFQTCIDG